MRNRVFVAMSGGVDSSVAAWLLKEKGFDCTGAMMKLYRNEEALAQSDRGCCSLADAADARGVAFRLGIPFYVLNFTDCFTEQVIERFAQAYQQGITPNPCIDCNRYVKFDRFLKKACELEMAYVATGHYARIDYDAGSGRYLLKKGVDGGKDQSYVLYSLTQEQLSKTLLPLGGLCKQEVRDIARAQGFMNAQKRDSQEICFVPDGDYAGFIEKYTGVKAAKGRFLDADGNDLGEHQGLIRYTVGQRKGLGLVRQEPVYVCAIRPENNVVVVGRAEELFSKVVIVKDINLIALEKLSGASRVGAKIRYKQPEQPATALQIDEDTLRIEFDTPQRAVTKGQAAVLYDGDVVIGGGTIV